MREHDTTSRGRRECPCITALMLGRPAVCGPRCWHGGYGVGERQQSLACTLCGGTGFVREPAIPTPPAPTPERPDA
jgi:hypothetical protein